MFVKTFGDYGGRTDIYGNGPILVRGFESVVLEEAENADV